jgi:hypothetical protein
VAILNARTTAFHQAMFASACIAVIGFIAACFVRDSDAANSMQSSVPLASAEAH